MAIIMKAQPVINKLFKNWKPYYGLTIFTNSKDEGSKIYVQNKEKFCAKHNVKCNVIEYPSNESTFIRERVKALCNGKVMCQKPYPSVDYSIDDFVKEMDAVDDADKFSIESKNIFNNDPSINNAPATPAGVMRLLDYYIGLDKLSGMNAVVIGRSEIAGRPIAKLLDRYNCTVTLCHSYTKNLAEYTKNADLIVSAVGQPNLVTADMVKENSIIVDVGIRRGTDGKIHGDCDYDNLVNKVYAITPVPGGVGPMTVASLIYGLGGESNGTEE